VTIQENVPLAPRTTLGVGGPARWFAHATSEADLLDAVRFARERGLPLFVLGGGSNLLVADAGFDGVVLHAAIAGPVSEERRDASVLLDVPAGVEWDAFVDTACRGGYTGVECLAGIPGLVGGSPIQNIGAYGQEVAQTIVSVRALNLDTLEFVTLPAAECQFAYRSSLFNTTHRGRFIVTGVAFVFDLDALPKLSYADLRKHFDGQPDPTPVQIAAAVRAIRAQKGMVLDPADLDSRSAGSFFKNPIVPAAEIARLAALAGCREENVPQYPAGAAGMIKLSAAWLMELSGFRKGFTMGRAGLSSKHVLALVNRGGATAAEIVALRDTIQAGVAGRTGICLEQEPVPLGF
jgi:UDP-N-acetylmuramate dehydrogenase